MAITILSRRNLPGTATAGATSTVGEPSVARLDDQALYTGNWYAAKSGDDGANWVHLDPSTFFPSADDGFCCDQTTLYDPSRNLFVWLLQYARTAFRNTLRLAVKGGPTLEDDSAWRFWDFVPDRIDPAWTDQWFDFNHAALSDNFLYVVTNTFTTTEPETFTRCVVFRVSLDDLRSGVSPRVDFFETSNFSLRCSQGATDTMYFGSHVDEPPARLRVFRWRETDATASSFDLPVASWQGGNGYFAPGPDGRNWLGRSDPRITAGWVSAGVIGFMWTVDRAGTRPQPHVRVARIDEASLSLRDEPDIWSQQVAFAFPDVCPNGDGEIGVTLFFGGGPAFPSHAVGAWDDAAGRWELRASRNGTHGPADGKWGDYLTCRPGHAVASRWAATGFVLNGGSDLSFVQPFVVQFSR